MEWPMILERIRDEEDRHTECKRGLGVVSGVGKAVCALADPSDRVVITNPGTRPDNMTVESLISGGHPRSRNESMANYMLAMGAMEQGGRRWSVMRRAMREFNDTEPLLVQDEGVQFVSVTLTLRPRTPGQDAKPRRSAGP